MQPDTRYASYWLRLWQVQNDHQATWIATVHIPATGERLSFSSVGALLEFLQAEFGECEPASDDRPLEYIEATR